MKIEYVIPHKDGETYGLSVDKEMLEMIQQTLREKILKTGDIDKLFELCQMWREIRDGLNEDQAISDAHDTAIVDELMAFLDGNTGEKKWTEKKDT